jgi:regulator of protease activity HflC (stomatin/prohibitin superfamily)
MTDVGTVFLGFIGIAGLVVVVTFVSAIRVVPEHQRLAVFRLGRYIGERGPGLVFLLPIVDRGVLTEVLNQTAKVQSQRRVFGAVGETATLVHETGSVLVDGDVWSAVSREPIPSGARVRVTRVILEVERL